MQTHPNKTKPKKWKSFFQMIENISGVRSMKNNKKYVPTSITDKFR